MLHGEIEDDATRKTTRWVVFDAVLRAPLTALWLVAVLFVAAFAASGCLRPVPAEDAVPVEADRPR
jgi:hypothetical protein